MSTDKFEHRVGSHSDDYGGDSDLRCTCQDNVTDLASEHKSVPKTSPPDYKQEIDRILQRYWELMSDKTTPKSEATFSTHTLITHLIETEKKKARIGEMNFLLDAASRNRNGDYLDAALKGYAQARLKELQGEV
jgi:hypothetical protein